MEHRVLSLLFALSSMLFALQRLSALKSAQISGLFLLDPTETIMSSKDETESALYGIKLHVDRYRDAVIDALKNAGIHVIPSPSCFKVLHTSFRGSLKDLLQQVPALSHYPVKQYTWWRKLTDSIKRD